MFFSAFAEKLSEQDKKEVNRTLTTSLTYLNNGNWLAHGEQALAPNMWSYIAKQENTTVDKLKQQTNEINRELNTTKYTLSYSYDLNNVEVNTSSANRKYMFIPTKVNIENQQDNSEKSIIPTLLFVYQDNQRWYYLEWVKHSIILIKAVYPDLQDIKPPQR